MLANDKDGNLWAWGRNNAGQLGLGDNKSGNHGQPQQVVQGIVGSVVKISAGRMHSLALTSKGTVYSWGQGRDAQLGLGDKNTRKSPTKIDTLDNVVEIACGRDSSFALTADGGVYSWGRDDFGQLAHGRSQRFVTKPRRIESLDHEKIVSISVGEYHGVAVSSDGRIFSWGMNKDGQLGIGTRNNVTQPVQIESFEAMNVFISSAACGDGHTAALDKDGNLYAWGRGRSGELGRGGETESNAAYRSEPLQVPLPSKQRAIQIQCGAEHTLCVLE